MKQFWIIAAILWVGACTPQVVFEDEAVTVRVLEDASRYEALRLDSTQSDGYQLVSGQIRNDTLLLTTQYGGGCGQVEFTLVVNEATTGQSGNTPIRESVLALEDSDNCEAWITDVLPFPLSDLPRGPYTLYVYNGTSNGEVVTVNVP